MKHIISATLYFLGFLALLISSCAPAYIPNVVNTPMLTNAGEVQASIHTGSAGTDVQLAGSPVNHLGLVLNGSFASRDTGASYHQHRFVELGAGYYRRLGETSPVVVEAYGGAGLGRFNSYNFSPDWDFSNHVSAFRVYAQPGIGVTTSVVDASFCPRICYLHLYQGTVSANAIFVEPTLTFKAGYKYVKGVAQLGFSVPMAYDQSFDYQPFLLSLGLQVTIGKQYGDGL